MNLSQLEVLVAIVNTGNLTEAGEAVGLTQSAVSYSLSKLEAELGITLLERGRQGITVTRIGEEVVQHARTILTQIEVIREKTARERGLSVGKLRFGAVPNIPSRLLTGIIRDFRHRYPDIEIVMFEGNIQEVMNWLENGIIDIGTTLTLEDYAASVALGKVEVKVLVSVNHPLAAQSEIAFETLAHEVLIGSKAEYATISRLPELVHMPIPPLRYEVSALNAIYAMVGENMGIAIVHDKLMDPDVESVVGLSIQPKLFLNVYLTASIVSPAVDAFLKTATNWVKEHGFFPTDT